MEDPLEQIVAELKDGSIRRSQRTAGALSRTALFVGAAGTGKTKSANEIASQLGADLYRIDLSRIVSKYIGETERNIERVFAEAEDRGAVLQLDEAGAVFGKRSEVLDAHDRYANPDVSYLLQRVESYAGLLILTTHQKDAIDAAFLRRLRVIVALQPVPPATLQASARRRRQCLATGCRLREASAPGRGPKEPIDIQCRGLRREASCVN